MVALLFIVLVALLFIVQESYIRGAKFQSIEMHHRPVTRCLDILYSVVNIR